MKEWSYVNDTPFVPVKLLGKRNILRELGLLDSGARLCVLHENHAEDLELDKVDKTYTTGFGSKRKIPVELAILSLEIFDSVENIQCIVLKDRYYPEKLSKFIIGRNLLNGFRIVLDGRNKKIYLE